MSEASSLDVAILASHLMSVVYQENLSSIGQDWEILPSEIESRLDITWVQWDGCKRRRYLIGILDVQELSENG